MKKCIALFVALALLPGLFGCGNAKEPETTAAPTFEATREEIDKLVTVCDTPEQVVEHLCKIVIL